MGTSSEEVRRKPNSEEYLFSLYAAGLVDQTKHGNSQTGANMATRQLTQEITTRKMDAKEPLISPQNGNTPQEKGLGHHLSWAAH